LITQGFDFDLIDAHYYYPDGVAAAIIAEKLEKPFVVTSRGTDLNLIADYERPRKLILETANQAAASIGVCQALMNRLEELGANHEKLNVLRNGVDLERFQPVDRLTARNELGLPRDKRILLSVGHLIERKGHHIAISALGELTDCMLIIAGTGPELDRLQNLAINIGVNDRVRFVGQVPNDRLSCYYSAANALILCSSREGWANVLLESMACGTPVVATNIWGTPEVIANDTVGQLMMTRDTRGLLQAVNKLFENIPRECVIRKYAEMFSWQATTQGQIALFDKILCKGK
jgi:glycosyltransferase involved in cell wall biosynthesis